RCSFVCAAAVTITVIETGRRFRLRTAYPKPITSAKAVTPMNNPLKTTHRNRALFPIRPSRLLREQHLGTRFQENEPSLRVTRSFFRKLKDRPGFGKLWHTKFFGPENSELSADNCGCDLPSQPSAWLSRRRDTMNFPHYVDWLVIGFVTLLVL